MPNYDFLLNTPLLLWSFSAGSYFFSSTVSYWKYFAFVLFFVDFSNVKVTDSKNYKIQ